MPSTPQSQAIALANEALAINAQLVSLYEQASTLLQQWNDVGAAAVLNSLATAPLNADGSLGTADAAPNTSHPIDTRVATELSRAISASDLAALVGYPISNFQAMCNGSAIAAIGGLRAVMNKAQG